MATDVRASACLGSVPFAWRSTAHVHPASTCQRMMPQPTHTNATTVRRMSSVFPPSETVFLFKFNYTGSICCVHNSALLVEHLLDVATSVVLS